MATFKSYIPIDMSSIATWYGTVYRSTSTSIALTDYSSKIAEYTGYGFTYYGNLVTGGVLTGYKQYNYVSLNTQFEITGINVSASIAAAYVQNDNQYELARIALAGADLVQGSVFADTLLGFDGNDTVDGGSGTDVLDGGVGDDLLRGGLDSDFIVGGPGNDFIDGGAGYDYSYYAADSSTIVAASMASNGVVTIRTSFGTDTMTSVESVSFTDVTMTTIELLSGYAPPVYQTSAGPITASIYSGAVDFLQFQLLGSSSGDIATGSSGNDFINLLGGDDAANGGAGQDVLDGGVGSNFLTGGAGADTFFLDGRSGTNTWSTITDPSEGDRVNIWGWQQGTSQLILSLEGQGAEGFKGATFHYDLNGDRMIDTSITFSNVVLANVPAPSAEEVAGNGYLLFA